MDTPTEIVCPECQGTAHRMSFPPEDGFEPGDVVAFVCADCGSRFDVVVAEDDGTDETGATSG